VHPSPYNPARRRASAAPRRGEPQQNLPEPRRKPRCITHAAHSTLGQTPAQTESGSPQFTFSGRAPPRSLTPATQRRRPRPQKPVTARSET